MTCSHLPLVSALDRGWWEFLPVKSGVEGIRSLVIVDLREGVEISLPQL